MYEFKELDYFIQKLNNNESNNIPLEVFEVVKKNLNINCKLSRFTRYRVKYIRFKIAQTSNEKI